MEHETLAQAFLAAQQSMQGPKKTAKNTHFRSKYATLEDVLEACVPVLNQHGIALSQGMKTLDGIHHVTTTLVHGVSGEKVSFDVPLILGKADMQGLGSAITYARRYGALMACGVAPEDDDGNAASAPQRQPKPATEDLTQAMYDSVEDSLPPGASGRQRAEAYAEFIAGEFSGKGLRALDNAWERHKRIIDGLSGKHPDLFEKIVDAFEVRRMELDEKVRETITTPN